MEGLDPHVLQRFVGAVDRRLEIVYGYVSEDCPEDFKEFYWDVNLLMKIALARRPLTEEDRTRLEQRAK